MITYENGLEGSHVALNLTDEALKAYAQDEACAGIALREADPVRWLIANVALKSHKEPCEVTDMDLMAAAMLEARRMDTTVHRETKRYLSAKGMSWSGGCFG